MYDYGWRVLILPCLLVISMASVGMCEFKVLLLHTSDMHSRYNNVNIHKMRCQEGKPCFGGFARIRAAVEELREEAKHYGGPTLYLDAGDVFGESVYYKEFKSKLAVEMMNLLKPDAMSLGNHDFDDGVKELVPYVQNLAVPVVCSNIDVSKEPGLSKLVPSVTLDVKYKERQIKIGVVGYISPIISAENIGKNIKIEDIMKPLEDEARRLKEKENVKVVIALGHAGYYTDKEIAKNVDHVDVIVGGRSHFFLYPEGLKPSSSEKVDGPYPTIIDKGEKIIPILHASYGTKYLGHIFLEFNENGDVIGFTGEPILLDESKHEDQAIRRALYPYNEEIKKKYQNLIGETQILLKGKGCICRFQECNIGNLVTDAFVEVINKKYKTRDGRPVAQIGLIQSGDINADLHPKSEDYTGEIVMEDVITILPFDRHLEDLRIKGNVLRDVLESAVTTYDPEKGGLFRACLMQVSGLRIQYDMRNNVGERLTGVQVAPDYQELDDNAHYNVVMPDFLVKGGDGIQCSPKLAGQTRVVQLGDDAVDYIVVSEYIASHTPLREEDCQLEGRIKIEEPQKIRKNP